MKKIGFFIILFLLTFNVLPLTVLAAEEEETSVTAAEEAQIREEWEAFRDSIPSEVQELLPDGFFSAEFSGVEEGVAEASAPAAILSAVSRLFFSSFTKALSLLARLCGILVLGAVLTQLGGGNSGVREAFSFCSALAITLMIFSGSALSLSDISAYFKTIGGICSAFLPMMGVLYAMGGNIGTAVANQGVFSAFLVILETVCASSVVPIAVICIALALLSSVGDELSLRSLSNLIKRTFTVGLSFLMLLLCGVLGVQTTLAKAGDTLAMRTARFAAGSFLPVVGGSVAETLRTVSAGVGYLRGVVGTAGIVVLFFAFLPMFLSVLLARLAFLLAGAFAGMLSATREEKLLAEFASVYGYFLAVIASLFVMTVFSLTLFASCATAL